MKTWNASCAGGVYYRGQVAQVFDQQPDIEASEEQQEQYDPWEAVEVVWDGGKSSSGYGGEYSAYACSYNQPDLACMSWLPSWYPQLNGRIRLWANSAVCRRH